VISYELFYIALMEIFLTLRDNLLSPPILFFALGLLAGLIKSDLHFPDHVSRYLALYLMMAIGFKGGAALGAESVLSFTMVAALLGGVVISFLMPFPVYAIIRRTTKLDAPTAAAVAAHYGSISMVTFVTAEAFLKNMGVPYESYIIAVLALMEAPAIVAALIIARTAQPAVKQHDGALRRILTHDIFTNGAILMLLGALMIGALTGEKGMARMEGFLVVPFGGVLCLFLLDMGLLVARQIHHLKAFTWPLALVGLYVPLLGALVGLGFARLIGMDVGTGMLLTVLCASASYIAVPAAMRSAMPEAKAAIYLPLSLGITFPLNIAFGIPLYMALAQQFLGTP